MGLYLKQLQLGPMQNFVYLVGDEESPETAVIDCAWDVDAVLAQLDADDRKLTHALVSHWHADHTSGLVPLLEAQGVRVLAGAADVGDLPEAVRGEAKGLLGGDAIEVGPLKIRALHTPGHTPGSITYHLEPGPGTGEGAVFSGDTLFVNESGRCDLKGGDPAQMWQSLKRLSELGSSVTLYPGHHYGDVPVSSIGREREKNPYLSRLGALEEFVALRMRPRK
jgi:glyoxylase-like metal-dependent hydrolase (beta-lactamase superfamily II)